jgi:hypothetical protein
LAYLSGIVLAVLGTVKASPFAFIVVGALFLLSATPIFFPGFHAWWNERDRRIDREQHGLRSPSHMNSDCSPSSMPDNHFGFEEIDSLWGLQNGSARVKPNRFNPEDHEYPLELHKYSGEIYLGGWLSGPDFGVLTSMTAGCVTLWMKNQSKDRGLQWAPIPLSRIAPVPDQNGTAHGDGDVDNGFRLVLDLQASAPSGNP